MSKLLSYKRPQWFWLKEEKKRIIFYPWSSRMTKRYFTTDSKVTFVPFRKNFVKIFLKIFQSIFFRLNRIFLSSHFPKITKSQFTSYLKKFIQKKILKNLFNFSKIRNYKGILFLKKIIQENSKKNIFSRILKFWLEIISLISLLKTDILIFWSIFIHLNKTQFLTNGKKKFYCFNNSQILIIKLLLEFMTYQEMIMSYSNSFLINS